jgi:hypothetical protein
MFQSLISPSPFVQNYLFYEELPELRQSVLFTGRNRRCPG